MKFIFGSGDQIGVGVVRYRRGRVRAFTAGLGDWKSTVVFGLAAFIAFPTVAAYSDIASLISGQGTGRARWEAHLTTAPAGSVQSAEMTFADPILTGSLSPSAGVTMPDGRRIALQGKIGAPESTPDEDRVNRAAK